MAPTRPRRVALSLALLALLAAAATRAEIASADLTLVRTVTERDWLDLRLQVLGLQLSYPAYRIHLGLGDSPEGGTAMAATFTFWLSGAMADHLQEYGRAETERVLKYHARGIANQVGDLLREDFPELWPRYAAETDVVGRFLTPGKEVDDAPLELAVWRGGELEWTYKR